ncbi:MAG TPA: succinyl-diaminopimelate desuccinylase [Hellea balneolensis]|uniref:Succinyl-diaminopimelate desuccinylase n=1 Tax=Hellea balneolensis TaxID=287478 RepID=A0A7V5NW99_9PROT|nr:succinyl-diaminopimelate desuccinylase [Hellea balneolensis]
MPGIDPIDLARALIRCPSVTPRDAGALDVVERVLAGLGFRCTRYRFGEVDNLYARLGTSGPNLCYAGHTDVVPVGDVTAWRFPPFAAKIHEGRLYGRGASDMKGGIAAFIAAVSGFLAEHRHFDGSISLLITGDEEGPAINGTVKVLDALQSQSETIDHCLVGEPTNPQTLGEMIKIGRRGSLNGHITVSGQQGHVAYPDLAHNPVPVLLRLLTALSERKLDAGNAHFQPSNLEITSVDVNNPAHNVIAGSASARFNIRFNTEHRGEELIRWIEKEAEIAAQGFDGRIDLDLKIPGRPFLTQPGRLSETLCAAIEAVTGRTPELSTSGGTSDARFISRIAPVVEFGLIGKTIHKIDEYADVSDILTLTEIYKVFMEGYFEL